MKDVVLNEIFDTAHYLRLTNSLHFGEWSSFS